MKNLIFAFTLAYSTSSHALIIQCVGMDKSGQTIHVLYDGATYTININGHIFKLINKTQSGTGFATENFISDSGEVLYFSFGLIDNTFFLTQFNAVTNKLISHVELTCH
ncbi:hypothetical protein [Legionella genomosp. 1]|uniref:hypothetical protein n=1 Tax=Legionella genomosp. 1 TaxID=1093625 RepID=UPI0010562EED|nr:hypothetical protein [Legionella genomosp. 1]